MAATPAHASLHPFKLDDLAPYTPEGVFAGDESPDYRAFYVGRDDVHGILKYLLAGTTRSLRLNMFGYDDEELNALICSLIVDDGVFVQGTLDKSQAGGVHERKILAAWTPQERASFAVGTSATHQISHTKGGVIDGLVAFEGSTNWSASGEGSGIGLPTRPGAFGTVNVAGYKAQNNTLLVHVNPAEVRKFSLELDEEHAVALRQSQNGKSPA